MLIHGTYEEVARVYRAHMRSAWLLSESAPHWAAAHYRVALDLCEGLIVMTRMNWDVVQVYEAEREGIAFCLGELERGYGRGVVCGRLLPKAYRERGEFERLARLEAAEKARPYF